MQDYTDIQRWIASGYALEVVALVKADDAKDDLDEETLTQEIQAFALENLVAREDEPFNPTLIEQQLMWAIEAAAKASIEKTLAALSDKDMIQTSIREDGELVLGLTAKGLAFSDMLTDGYIKPEDFNNNFNEGKYD
jgi:hypothetical protein